MGWVNKEKRLERKSLEQESSDHFKKLEKHYGVNEEWFKRFGLPKQYDSNVSQECTFGKYSIVYKDVILYLGLASLGIPKQYIDDAFLKNDDKSWNLAKYHHLREYIDFDFDENHMEMIGTPWKWIKLREIGRYIIFTLFGIDSSEFYGTQNGNILIDWSKYRSNYQRQGKPVAMKWKRKTTLGHETDTIDDEISIITVDDDIVDDENMESDNDTVIDETAIEFPTSKAITANENKNTSNGENSNSSKRKYSELLDEEEPANQKLSKENDMHRIEKKESVHHFQEMKSKITTMGRTLRNMIAQLRVSVASKFNDACKEEESLLKSKFDSDVKELQSKFDSDLKKIKIKFNSDVKELRNTSQKKYEQEMIAIIEEVTKRKMTQPMN